MYKVLLLPLQTSSPCTRSCPGKAPGVRSQCNRRLAHPEAEDQPGWGNSPLPPGWVHRGGPKPGELAVALGSCSAWRGCKVIGDIKSRRRFLRWWLPRRLSLSGALPEAHFAAWALCDVLSGGSHLWGANSTSRCVETLQLGSSSVGHCGHSVGSSCATAVLWMGDIHMAASLAPGLQLVTCMSTSDSLAFVRGQW